MLKFLKTMNLIAVIEKLPLLLCFCLSGYILTTVAEYFVEKSKCQ